MATNANQKPVAAAASATKPSDAVQATPAAGAAPAAAEGDAEARKRAPAANFLPIVRGRLPLLFVHAVRFDPVVSAMAKKDSASKLATSVGKIFDIQKGRNFEYVKTDFKPSAEDVTAAKAWASQTGAANAKGQTAVGDKALMDQLIAQYEKRGLATPEDSAKFAAARTASRPAKAPAAATAPAGAAVQSGAAASGQALLS